MSARRPGRSARFSDRASGSPARGVQLRRERKPEDRRVRKVRHLTSFVHLSQPTTGGEALRSIKNSHLRQTQNVCDTGTLPLARQELRCRSCTPPYASSSQHPPHRSAARHLRRGARARRHRHVRRRGGGRVAQARSARGEVEARPRRSCGPRHDPHDVDLVARRDGAARRRVDRVAERIDRGAVRRRAPDRLDLSARPAHDAAQRARPRRVRAVRRVGRAARTRRQGLHRRQRAEPEPVLDAAVRRRRP